MHNHNMPNYHGVITDADMQDMKAMKETTLVLTGWGAPISLTSLIKRILTPDAMYFRGIGDLIQSSFRRDLNQSWPLGYDLSYWGGFDLPLKKRANNNSI